MNVAGSDAVVDPARRESGRRRGRAVVIEVHYAAVAHAAVMSGGHSTMKAEEWNCL